MASNPRIVELAAFDNPREGSFVPMLLGLTEAAKASGWAAEAVFGEPAGDPHPWTAQFEQAGVAVRYAPAGNRRELGRWVKDLAEESPAPTVLHTHFTTFDVPAVLAARGRAGASVVWHEHTRLNPHPMIVARNLAKFGVLGRMTDRILCPSQDTVASVKRLGAPSSKVTFLPNAIALDRFPLVAEERRIAARQQLGLSPEATVLLHFGWDWKVKGGDVFLRTLKALRDSGSEASGLEVTNEPDAHRLRDELDLGTSLAIAPLQRDVQALYAAANLFVATSRAEGGTPFAIIEALSSGLPVVASDLAGHRFIAESIPGCTISDPDPRRLAEAVAARLERGAPFDPAEAAQVRERVSERFGLRDWTQRVMEMFEALVAPA